MQEKIRHRSSISDRESEGLVRQKIIELISTHPWDAQGLSRNLRISQHQVEAHLKHVQLSAQVRGQKFIIWPAHCPACGFEFAGRERTTKPSRCPKFRHEHIRLPMFEIRICES